MQALFEHSEEGECAGLGLLPGNVRRFPAEAMRDADGNKLKVPHIGWNQVHQGMAIRCGPASNEGARFYFVHSYYAEPADPALVAGFAHYPFAFTCAVARDNVFAVQFHPEKSQAAGSATARQFHNLGRYFEGKPCSSFRRSI
jgi:imidazole glycerol-phosphate synthase subunit HisH